MSFLSTYYLRMPYEILNNTGHLGKCPHIFQPGQVTSALLVVQDIDRQVFESTLVNSESYLISLNLNFLFLCGRKLKIESVLLRELSKMQPRGH